MTITARNLAIAAVTSMLFAQPMSVAMAQGAEKPAEPKKVLTPEEKAEADFQKAVKRGKLAEAFYTTSTPLEVTLNLNVKRIRGDKADKAPWRKATFAFADSAGKQVVIPAETRTRGIWRLKNCDFPPLRLNFKSEDTKGTLLQGIDKPKLVNFCKDSDDNEQYMLQEAQLYRIYNLLTPASHRMRPLIVNYVDSASGKLHAKRFGMLLEEPEVMAARNGGPIMELKGALPQDLEPYYTALVGVFQYFIGNTDFSIYALHNIELIMQPTGNFLPVAYDFDFSGAIATNYATPDPKLAIQNVKMRLYRGYCVPPEEYQKVIAKFNEQKAAIYALYTDDIGKMMKPKVVENTLKYYDEFYKTINDPKRVKREIGDDCVKTN